MPVTLAGSLLALGGCVQTEKNRGLHAPTPGNVSAAAEDPVVALPDNLPGLHNVFVVEPMVYSGSGPASAEAFDSLAGLGVKTVISVDGARPELELAHARGMRYVHVPIGYDGMGAEQAELLTKALRDAEGPVYFHCHHGKHRGPTGAAVALIGLGRMSHAKAESFMEQAGTSTSYPGLWACAAAAEPIDDAVLDALPGELPEYQHVSGLIDGMVAIDVAWGHMKVIREAGWRVPAGHPDLAPAAEAGALADHFRVLVEDPDTRAEGAEFVRMMHRASERASTLEGSLTRVTWDERFIERAYLAVGESCAACHKAYRN